MASKKSARPLMAWFREVGGETDCTISEVRPNRGVVLGAVAVPEWKVLLASESMREEIEKMCAEVWDAAVAHTEETFGAPKR